MKILLDKLDYPEDCRRLVNALEQAGYGCTLGQAEELWSAHSNTLFAGWLHMDGHTNASLLESVLPFIEIGNR